MYLAHLFFIKSTPVTGLLLALFGGKDLLRKQKKGYHAWIRFFLKYILFRCIDLDDYLRSESCPNFFSPKLKKFYPHLEEKDRNVVHFTVILYRDFFQKRYISAFDQYLSIETKKSIRYGLPFSVKWRFFQKSQHFYCSRKVIKIWSSRMQKMECICNHIICRDKNMQFAIEFTENVS